MGGWVGDRLEDVGQSISGAVQDVERAVIRPIGGPIEKAGRQLDDSVNENIPGGWLTVGALGAGGYGLMNAGAGAGAAAEASFVAADAAQLAAQGLSQSQIAQTLGASGIDAFIAADAAQLAAQGLSASQIGSILAQQTMAPVSGALSPTLSIKDAMQGARLVSGLMGGQQPVMQPGAPGAYSPQGAVDYSGLYSLLAAKPQAPSLLGTRFMPENASIAEYLKAEKVKNLLG